MRVEARIDGQPLMIEAPAGGSIDKGGLAKVGDPDEVLKSIADAVRIVASHVGSGLQLDAYVPPVAMEVQFSVRVDDKAIVSVGLTPGEGQFVITLKYDA